MRHVLIVVLGLCLSASAVHAQSVTPGAVRNSPTLKESAREAAIKLARAPDTQDDEPYRPGGMKPGYFWTSIGLLAAGGLYLTTAALISHECAVYGDDCGGLQGGVAVVGAGMAGAGAIVWFAGKRHGTKPQISFTPGGVAVRGRIRF